MLNTTRADSTFSGLVRPKAARTTGIPVFGGGSTARSQAGCDSRTQALAAATIGRERVVDTARYCFAVQAPRYETVRRGTANAVLPRYPHLARWVPLV